MLPPPMTTRGLDAERLDFADLARDLRGDRRIDPEGLLAHQRFAGELQEDAGVDGRGHARTIIADRVLRA